MNTQFVKRVVAGAIILLAGAGVIVGLAFAWDALWPATGLSPDDASLIGIVIGAGSGFGVFVFGVLAWERWVA